MQACMQKRAADYPKVCRGTSDSTPFLCEVAVSRTQQAAGGRLRLAPLRARQVVLALREVHIVDLHRQLDVIYLHRVICSVSVGLFQIEGAPL